MGNRAWVNGMDLCCLFRFYQRRLITCQKHVKNLKLYFPPSLTNLLIWISQTRRFKRTQKNCASFCAPKIKNPCKYLTYNGLSFFKSFKLAADN